MGEYTLLYDVTDDEGVSASVERCVNVAPVPLPETKESEKVIYLTFDDGPCEYTAELLEWSTENGYSFRALDSSVPECHSF